MADKPFDPYDWRTHRVADCPRLVKYQQYLNDNGLKDPWIRNEVWRFLPKQDTRSMFYRLYFRGLIPGFLAAVAVTIGLKAYKGSSSDSHGGH